MTRCKVATVPCSDCYTNVALRSLRTCDGCRERMRSRNGLLPEANKLTSVHPSARSTAAQCGKSKSVRCSFSLALRQNTHTSLRLHYRPPAEDAVLTRARALGARGCKRHLLVEFPELGFGWIGNDIGGDLSQDGKRLLLRQARAVSSTARSSIGPVHHGSAFSHGAGATGRTCQPFAEGLRAFRVRSALSSACTGNWFGPIAG